MKTQAGTFISRIKRATWLTVGIIAAGIMPMQAQQLYKLGPQTTMQIDGTSTLHDWSSVVEIVRGEGKFMLEENRIAGISGLKVSVLVKSIKSGKGSMMDNNTYKALKSSQYPEIVYELQTIQVLANQKLRAKGKLTVAGVTQTTDIELNYQIEADKINLQGELPIMMKAYNIDPPTAMMGTIKTGEEVKVLFNAVFTASSQLSTR